MASKMLMELKHEDATGRMNETMEQVLAEMADRKLAKALQAALNPAPDSLAVVMLKKPH